jgi:hypothetical protein
MISCDNVTLRYLNNFIMDFLKIVNFLILFRAQVNPPKKVNNILKRGEDRGREKGRKGVGERRNGVGERR